MAEDLVVVEQLRAAGVLVNSVFDLVNEKKSCPEAISPLLSILPRLRDPWIKEGVVRALTDPAARGVAARPLVDELRAAADRNADSLAWAIGNALAVVADESVVDDLLSLVVNQRLGIGRQTVALALARFKEDPRVVQTLIRLLADDSVAAHALVALRKLKAFEAREHVRALLVHRNRLVRREAEKTFKAFGGPSQSGVT